MTVSWIVVADSGRARIFASSKTGTPWQEIIDLTHAESRMSGSELDTDRPGRSHDSLGQGRHAMEPPQTRKTKEAGVFAAQVAAYLQQNNGQYDKLLLVCAPRFLGLMRKQLGKTSANKISGEIASNVVHERLDKIQALVLKMSP